VQVDLSPQAVERIAVRVAQLLGEGREEPELMSAGELALRLKVERPWVYRHRDMLGGMRIGAGPKAPLRFDYGVVMTRLRKLEGERPEGGER
jgi:hypothetical protein